MPWKDLITPRQWLACDPLPPGLDLTSKHWVSLSNAVSHSHSGVHWLWLLRKFVIPLFGKLRIFGVFILAKCCGSFTKSDTYFLRSLDLSLFLSKLIFLHLLSDWKIKEICFNSIVGPGLSFAAFPEGIQAQMPAATNWAVMFFFMLFAIGLGSQIRQISASLVYKCIWLSNYFLSKIL